MGKNKPEKNKSTDGDHIVTAQVVVRSQSGKPLRGDVPITTKNITEYQPSSSDTETVKAAFGAAGFEAGNLVGISFAISAPLKTFEKFFSTNLRIISSGAVKVAKSGYELPLTALPPSLARLITVVTFMPPADLHAARDAMMA